MKIGAVICECNPFHFGHAYLLDKMKRQTDAVVAVMSGSFTQRGEAAVLSKYERARLLVLGGADLVLELPFPFCSSSAGIFASGGVDVIDRLGCVRELWFGSETGDTEKILLAAKRMHSEEFQNAFSEALSRGYSSSHRRVRTEVYRETFGEDAIFHGSNDILAAEYASRLIERGSGIIPVAVRRKGEAFNGGGGSGGGGDRFVAASTIRRMMLEGNEEYLAENIPPLVFDALMQEKKRGKLADGRRLYPMITAALRSHGEKLLSEAPDMTEELADRILSAALSSHGGEEIVDFAATKLYSASRIRRALLAAFLGVRKEDTMSVPYTTVLAANGAGRGILSSIRKSASIPVITKPADYRQYGPEVRRAFELSARADSVWELLCDVPRDGTAMLREKPVMV